MRRGSRFNPPAKSRPYTIRVYAEGEETETQYLTHLNRKNRHVQVSVAGYHHQPMPLVNKAIKELRADRRSSNRAGAPFDEYWVVFDLDAHPLVSEAVARARAAGLNVALSAPCLELWFVWHFEDCNRAIERGPIQDRAYALLKCTKSALTEQAKAALLSGTQAAVTRARAAERRHLGNGLSSDSNPSSGLWRLVQTILTTGPSDT